MNQEKINSECLSLIENLKSICWNTTIDIATAKQYGLQDHDFSELDLKKLKEFHDNFLKAYNEIMKYLILKIS